ncbi:MAG: type IX secretion system sortase PorU, partial [Fidelibacterota bacterium]
RGGNDSGSHRVAITLNQSQMATATATAHGYILLQPNPDLVSTAVNSTQNVITVINNSTDPDPQEEVWLDWVELEYSLDLTASDNQLNFLLPQYGEQASVRLMGFTAQPMVLDITDPAQPVIQQLHEDQDRWLFTPLELTSPRRFAATADNRLLTPGPPTYHQDLDFTTLRQTSHQADYVIITESTLLNQAQELAAIHSGEVRPDLRLSTYVATIGEIYEEFSGGMVDPLAIRAFLRWTYDFWAQPAPKLVVLFGDGDYDYRNLSGMSHNLIPTIQVDGSSEISSRTVDDAFVYLDSVPVPSPLPDMGIGRIAVSTLEEADLAIDMIRSYMVEPESGSWRQRILLAADDPVRPNNDEPNFILESEQLAQLLPASLQVIKLYLTEYTEAFDPATNSIIKPDATNDLINAVNQGVTLINYIGHGSSSQWAQEQLLKMERDRALLQVGQRLPVWFAGTCTWGRFDQLDIPSMSEVLTASTENAAIAVVSAVRAVYASANYRFISDLFTQTFPGRKPAPLRIGEIVQNTKTGGASDEKFHLFGDPAILIGLPREPLTLDPVTPDTLKVLGTGAYSGSTGDGGIASGECLVTILDSPNQVTRPYRTLNGINRNITYTLAGAPVFRGSAAISNGSFDGQFIIPKDINYRGLPAKIIGYGWSDLGGLLLEQIGYRDDLIIYGTEAAGLDSTGPLVTLYWNERPLTAEDALPENAQIEVELNDPLGINLTGEVGHSIRIWLDDESAAEVVNPLFQYNTGSHTAGRFPYQFDPTLTGRHEFFVEAWDGANNKTISTTTLYLTLEEELSADHLYNYPNPFQEYTEFVYTLSRPAQVTITIYTLNGIKVLTLESLGEQGSGFQRLPENEAWDGRDAFGDQIANGTYLYRFQASSDGRTITRWGRLARLR